MAKGPTHAPETAHRVFADLRRHNEYAAKVAHLLETERKRRVEQVLRTQRKHRLHQAR